MATVKITSSSSTFVADQADTFYMLQEGASLFGSNDYGIDARSAIDGREIRIDGQILDATTGVAIGNYFSEGAFAHNNVVTIGATGLIQVEDVGIGGYGNNDVITNNGTIASDPTIESNGISIEGDNAHITNNGLVSAHYGIQFSGTGGVITNAGSVVSTLAVIMSTADGETGKLINSGDITASSEAIWGDDGEETVINSGQINGNIRLAAGDDQFVSRGGHVHGTVMGGLGNDTFIVDNKNILLDEMSGEGFDRVKSSISWTLGDNIEEATLTGKKNINLTGNDSGSFLYGNAGSNRIKGDMGLDWITGGKGNDVLTGGDGVSAGDIADFFVFKPHSGKDVITDFQDGMDKINLQTYTGIDDFSDLKGHVKQSGDDLIVTLLDGDQITLRDMDKINLSETDFTF
jgi:Ca2+-binding RTX toxin-like protein